MKKIIAFTIIIAAFADWTTIIASPYDKYAFTGPPPVPEMFHVKQLAIVDQVTVSAYTSRPEETDSTPCTAARGADICSLHKAGYEICASNDYPIGTEITLGFPVWIKCKVLDRMNARYTGKHRVDIYFGNNLGDAREFGIKKNVEVLK